MALSKRSARPMPAPVLPCVSSLEWASSASIASSSLSGSLKPSGPKILMPLSANGLWLARLTAARHERDRAAEPQRELRRHRFGVGTTADAVGAEKLSLAHFSANK